MKLLVFEHGRGLEIVTKAKGVAHFVHGHLLDRLLNELFGDLFARLKFVTTKHHHGGHSQFIFDVRPALAIAVAGGKVGRLEALGRFVPPCASFGCRLQIGRDQRRADEIPAHPRCLDRACGGARFGKAVFGPVKANHARIKDNVRVDDLAGEGVGSRWPHGVALIGRDPAEGVVVDVLGVEFLVFLLADLDGVAKADLFKGLVPFENPFTDGGSVFIGNRVFDPIHDLFFRGGKLGGIFGVNRFGPLQPPSVNVPDEGGVHCVAGKILDHA